MALFLPAGEVGNRKMLANRLLVGKRSSGNTCCGEGMSRKQEDPSSTTEVLVCSALEVPTMWGKLGF